MGEKLTMVITMRVKGKEELNVTVEYKDTTLETVRLVENAIMGALSNINNG